MRKELLEARLKQKGKKVDEQKKSSDRRQLKRAAKVLTQQVRRYLEGETGVKASNQRWFDRYSEHMLETNERYSGLDMNRRVLSLRGFNSDMFVSFEMFVSFFVLSFFSEFQVPS